MQVRNEQGVFSFRHEMSIVQAYDSGGRGALGKIRASSDDFRVFAWPLNNSATRMKAKLLVHQVLLSVKISSLVRHLAR